MIKVINLIMKLIYNFILLFYPEKYRRVSMSYMQMIKYSCYNKWIQTRFNLKNASFVYPINSIRNPQYMNIGPGTIFGKMAVLTTWDNRKDQSFKPKLNIGKGCNFGDYLHLTCINKIQIGDNILTGRWVTITDNSHGDTDFASLQLNPSDRELVSKGAVIIGDNVWIGDKATILPGVTIGHGAVIAANSVITKDIPPYSVAAGNPAKIIKYAN